MKNFILALLFSTLSFHIHAQVTATSGGPDSYGYSFKTSNHSSGPTYNWIDITSTGTLINGLGDDNHTGPFNIGFNFPYYWTLADNFYVGSNGYVSFQNGFTLSSGSGNPYFPYMPTNDAFDNFIAPLLSDLNFGGSGNPAQAYYYSNNIDTCIISFINVPFWNNNSSGFSGNNTFQVILNASDSSITFQYQAQSGSWNTSYDGDPGASIIGIESVGNTSGLQVAASELPVANFAIRFELNVNSSFTLEDLNCQWNDNEKNGGFFLSQQNSKDIVTTVTNNGTVDVNSTFNVTTYIIEQAGNNLATSLNSSVAGLSTGQSQTITHSPSLLLQNFTCNGTCNAGTYLVTTSHNHTDDYSANDVLTTEMVVLDESSPNSVIYSYTDGVSDGTFGFDGGAIYIQPAYYPADLTAVTFDIIAASAPASGFTTRILDDNGGNGAPGTVLGSETINAGAIAFNTATGSGNFHTVTLSSPITIGSGGVYITFEPQNGTTDIALGEDNSTPFSNRNYEILSGTFGEYRSNDQADLMIQGIFDMTSGAPILVISSQTQPSCIGASDAQVTVSGTGGSGSGYMYSSDGTNFSTTNIFTGLAAGTYTYYVQDGAGGISSTDVTITNPSEITIGSQSVTNSSCGGSDGAMTITAAGGSGSGYTYSIDGANYQTSGTFTNLASGTYTIFILDGNNCSGSVMVTISDANAPTLSITTSSSPACAGGNDGSVTVSSTGGTGGNQYSIDGTNFQSSNTFNNLTAGSYTITVMDNSSCSSTTTFNLTDPDAIIFLTVSGTNPSCGSSDGAISASASGGTGTLVYSVDGTSFQANGNFTNLNSGSYTVTVRDANNCIETYAITLSDQGAPSFTLGGNQTVCEGETTNITVSASGGQPPYTYSIDGSTFLTSNIFSLGEGTYTFYVKDDLGCQAVPSSITIDRCTGINEEYQLMVEVFPNPSSGLFIVDLSAIESSFMQLSVKNILGAEILEEKVIVEKEAVTIDLNSHPDGMYFLNLSTPQGDNQLIKLIKE